MSHTPLILVVGMHRSGTSLLGSILQTLGVALPGPLIPGDKHNPEGYFERADITALQEELLIDLQRWWPSEAGLLAFPAGWLDSARSQRAAACLSRLLQKDLLGRQGPWAIKDPRTSLLLPLWRQVAGQLNLPLKLVLAIRDPGEVVVSLMGRDGGPAGMTQARAEGLWMRHHRQLLADSNGLPLHVVSYARWFSEASSQIARLASFCFQANALDAKALEEAQACIQPRHRRSQSGAKSIQLGWYTRRWHQRLEHAATSGQSDVLRRWAHRQPPSKASKAEPHPWSRALTALNSADLQAGLETWQTQGIPAVSLEQLSALQLPGLPGVDPAGGDGSFLPEPLNLELIGGDLEQWSTHLWLDQMPLQPAATLDQAAELQPDATLHLQPLTRTARNPALLLELSQRPRVFDPDPEQVRLLRLLGVNAEPLPSPISGQWLQIDGDPTALSTTLGLPAPSALKQLGGRWICLGRSEHPDWLKPPAGLLQIPSFPPAPALRADQSRLLAGWLKACLKANLQLVRLNPVAEEGPV